MCQKGSDLLFPDGDAMSDAKASSQLFFSHPSEPRGALATVNGARAGVSGTHRPLKAEHF